MASTSRDRAGRAVRAALAEADDTDGAEEADGAEDAEEADGAEDAEEADGAEDAEDAGTSGVSGASGEVAVGEADASPLPASPEGDRLAEVCDVV